MLRNTITTLGKILLVLSMVLILFPSFSYAEVLYSGTIVSLNHESGTLILRCKGDGSLKNIRMREEGGIPPGKTSSRFKAGDQVVVSIISALNFDPLIADAIYDGSQAPHHVTRPFVNRRDTERGGFQTSAGPAKTTTHKILTPDWGVHPAPYFVQDAGIVFVDPDGIGVPAPFREEEIDNSVTSIKGIGSMQCVPYTHQLTAKVMAVDADRHVIFYALPENGSSQGKILISPMTLLQDGANYAALDLRSLHRGDIVKVRGYLVEEDIMNAREIYLIR